MATEEGQRAATELLEDEKRFIDVARSPLWLADKHPLVGRFLWGGGRVAIGSAS